MKRTVTTIAVFMLMGLVLVAIAAGDDLAQHLQDVSVTIKAPGRGGESQGSGVIVTREMRVKEGEKEVRKINFVLTAAHVVDGLRSTRRLIDPKTGTRREKIDFKPAYVVQELTEDGRRVGELQMEAKVIRYSDSSNGHDLAILMVRKRDFVKASAKFYTGKGIPAIGTKVFHVGSLHGQLGANSMTSGIVSQIGRVVATGRGDGRVFDQTTATAFPGSSGGGIYLAANGEHIGVLTRGAGETFNLIVPIRRLRDWTKHAKIGWLLDEKQATPSLEELLKGSVEDTGISFSTKAENEKANRAEGLHFLIRRLDEAGRVIPQLPPVPGAEEE